VDDEVARAAGFQPAASSADAVGGSRPDRGYGERPVHWRLVQCTMTKFAEAMRWTRGLTPGTRTLRSALLAADERFRPVPVSS